MRHIVLYEPEIPQNTGNIIRLCVAFKMTLHIIRPAGFPLSMAALRRSSVNYVDDIDMVIHDTWEAFLSEINGKLYFVTRYGNQTPDTVDLSDKHEDVYLIFGSESAGVAKQILKQHPKQLIRIPMADKMRSLNLANSVAMLAYESARQSAFQALSKEEPPNFKGKNYLKD